MWRKGGKITDAHLMALIDLAQADPALAVKVREEEAGSAVERKAWSALWDRLSPVTTVIGGLVLAIGMMPATGRTKSLDIQQLARVDGAYSVYYVIITPAGASVQTIAYDNPVKAVRWPQ